MASAAVDVGNGDEVIPFPGRRARQDDVEDSRSGNSAKHLRDDIADRLPAGAVSCCNETAGHGRIEMAAGDVAHSISHREDGRTDGQSHHNETRGWRRKKRSTTDRAYKHECPDEFGSIFPDVAFHDDPPFAALPANCDRPA